MSWSCCQVQRALEYAYDDVEMAATYLMEGSPLGTGVLSTWPKTMSRALYW